MPYNKWLDPEAPGTVILDQLVEQLESGEGVRLDEVIVVLVQVAHRDLLGDEEALCHFYERIIQTIGPHALHAECVNTTDHMSHYMEPPALEEDYGILAGHLETLGALSCLGFVPPVSSRLRFDRAVSKFVSKRHQRGQLRAAIYNSRDDLLVWEQPICQFLLNAL